MENKYINTAGTTPAIRSSQRIIRKIGSTTYDVSLNFSTSSSEDINDKILWLIRNDPQNKKML